MARVNDLNCSDNAITIQPEIEMLGFSRILRVIVMSMLLVAEMEPSHSALAQNNCPVPAAVGTQRYPSAIAVSLELASQNRLSTAGSSAVAPELPRVWAGYPPSNAREIRGYVPCTLLKSIAYQESPGWKQFDAAYSASGYTIISYDCGYGIMQITGAPIMTGEDGNVDRNRVVQEDVYNIGTGARVLADKWNHLTAYVGDNNPRIAEHWYFAVWAYNGLTNDNNPNNSCPASNPECSYANNPNRPPFDGTQPKNWYPYQELIWGYAANPPNYAPPLNPATEYWAANLLTLPDRIDITFPLPAHIPAPEPVHMDCSTLYIPTARK
ncbi:MAG TPA: hypothetical protein P5333_04590 [Caldilinea sp.]|nr:hypothetical protein [Caldilinea sp.]